MAKINCNLFSKSVLALLFILYIQDITAINEYDAEIKQTENLIRKYIEQDKKNADSLCNLLINNSVENKYGTCLGYFYKGEIAYYQAEWSNAAEYYQKSIECLQTFNDTVRLAITYNNLGIVLLYQSFYHKALEAMAQSLEFEKKLNNRIGIAQSYQNMSLVYENQENQEKAIEYNLMAIKILEETDNKLDRAGVYNNQAVLYSNVSDYKSAETFYVKAMNIYKELDMIDMEAKVLCNIGGLFVKQQKYEEGGKTLEKALALFHINNDVTSEIHAYGMLADMYARKNEYPQAIFLSETAWEKVKDTDDFALQLRCLYSLYVYNKKMEKWKEALEKLEAYKELKDRLLALDSSAEEDILKIEMEHKLSEIEILNNQNNKVKNYFGITVILFLFIFIVGIITIRLYIRKLKK